MFVITKSVRAPGLDIRREWLRGAPYRHVVEAIARDMGDQARVNVLKYGEPGGAWPQLSGFNAQRAVGGKALKRLKARAGSLYGRDKNRAQLAAVQQENKAKRRKQKKRKERGEGASVPHDGYARRKALGKTPGHGKFGPDVRLRDTGSLFEGLDGQVKWTDHGATVSMIAHGAMRGRPSNNVLLRIHARGEGGMPKRNPAQDMGLFEARTEARFREWLGNAAKAANEGAK